LEQLIVDLLKISGTSLPHLHTILCPQLNCVRRNFIE